LDELSLRRMGYQRASEKKHKELGDGFEGAVKGEHMRPKSTRRTYQGGAMCRGRELSKSRQELTGRLRPQDNTASSRGKNRKKELSKPAAGRSEASWGSARGDVKKRQGIVRIRGPSNNQGCRLKGKTPGGNNRANKYRSRPRTNTTEGNSRENNRGLRGGNGFTSSLEKAVYVAQRKKERTW